MIRRLYRLLVIIGLISLLSKAEAKEYRIASAAELGALTLVAGDKVILKEGEWKDQRLIFKGTGTENLPIVLVAEKRGMTKLTGQSTLLIDGEWLVVEGLYFTDGYSLDKDVVVFSAESAHCRLTNSAVLTYNHPDKKVDYKWVSVWGHYNRVDHCWLQGKTHQGPTMVIWLDGKPNYHRVDHNYFGAREELGGNGGETIRIGNSTWSLSDSYTTVEKNIFAHCDGELEIISNKSCKNTICDNLFYESKGTLTLRHGNDAELYGNYFIGNGLPGTGGIRIIGENHKVHHNYFYKLTGTGMSAALSVMDGLPNPQLTSHWQVKNARVSCNTIVQCLENVVIGAGKNQQRNLPPLNTTFTENIISTATPVVRWEDANAPVQFQANRVESSIASVALPEGFVKEASRLKKDKYGMFRSPCRIEKKPFWLKKAIGPAWYQMNRLPIK